MRLDRTLGPQVVSWIEAHLVHGPGDVQGQPVELDDEQVGFVCRAYELDDQGRRVVRRAVFSRAKGRGKSSLAAMLVCAEALGPTGFRGWGHDGRPLGHPVTAPYIPCVATEEGQAGHVYQAAAFMLAEGSVSATPGLDVGMTRTFTPGGGVIRPVTARATSKEGGRESFAVFDETSLFTTPELLRLHETVRRNLAKRRQAEPWSLEVSTMYAVGEESVAELSHRYAVAVAEGRIDDRSLLFDHREAGEVDFGDDDELRAALRDVYGPAAEWVDVERLLAEARDPQTREDDFVRFFLNRATARSTHWLSPAAWQACADPDYLAQSGTRVVLAFDGSYRLDSSALVAATVEARPYLWVLGLWERPERAPADWVVDRAAVDATVRAAMETFDVAELAFDPPGWHAEADRWADLFGAVVVSFPTATRSRMAAACSRFYSAVMGGQVAHDGDARLARHLANAVLRDTAQGGYITKNAPNSVRKIDAAVAGVVAHERACWHRDNAPAYIEPFQAWA